MTTPDYSHQAIISGLRAEIDGKDKIIAEHQKLRIEGTVLVEAENEDEARDIVDELDVVHWSSEIENFEAEATNVEATF